jgi:threonine dehydratase
LKTSIVGVVSAQAPAYAHSFDARRAVEHPVTTKLADGLACRTPEPEALATIWRAVDRVVQVTDDELAAAMRMIFECTHNLSEGAGAAALAAAAREKSRIAGRRIAVVLSGGNVDRAVFSAILSGDTD